ncbi:hypothetical protein WG68_04995 [Arsukibacterium ikkense]|uniref:Uncharacterized protein n=1 Tax=Arsukibacterium ikkense TaxID=336831 RepID=A0A0M2V747_9GAMM|nr:hypothetical protein [Arsukibacterium ikkense]KKO46647.1 hypothetical protein WG68_04995 [Arsukibacterium ikkense]
MNNKQQRLKAIEKELVIAGILDVPGTLLFAAGLYATFSPDGVAFLPVLNNPAVVTSCLVLGGGMMLWGGYKLFTLLREKAQLLKMPG